MEQPFKEQINDLEEDDNLLQARNLLLDFAYEQGLTKIRSELLVNEVLALFDKLAIIGYDPAVHDKLNAALKNFNLILDKRIEEMFDQEV